MTLPADDADPSLRPGVRIAVDVGTVRVGVARSDPGGVLATPVTTLPRDEAGQSDLTALAELVTRLNAIEVVVGLPRTLRGDEGRSAEAARHYAQVLAEFVAPVEVRLIDERLTTVDAHRALRASGLEGRRHRAVIDQAAAVAILQVALDLERSTGRPPGDPVVGARRKPRRKGRTR